MEVCAEPGKRDRKGRRVLGREAWYELMRAYDASGLTQEVFCRSEGINYHTFVAWLGRRRQDGDKGAVHSGGFHEVSVSPCQAGSTQLEVMLPEGTVVRGADPQTVARLVHLLRS